jgi:exodeoxyribonuclease V alpha subunit
MNAHRINRGEMPEAHPQRDADFFFIEEEDPAQVVETIKGLCAVRLPRTYGFDPIQDIQVLSPMYRGETGATRLNAVLQEALNPFGPSIRRGEVTFRVGDKVMQVRNDYDREVFNGDVGIVSRVDVEDQVVEVGFPHRVVYDFSDLDELVLAYAVSCHKSQGSEYRAVVMPVTTQHYTMLQRNLLYTGVTRARKLVVLVGTKKALAIAVKNNRVAERYTRLAEKIRERAAQGRV